jgi:protein-L-isoaspartate(D-aspartate) O-methyltransferase
MVEVIASYGVRDRRILKAFETVPRHHFVDSGLAHLAYEDTPLPLGASGQTISQPFTVAYQTWLLNPMPGEKILEIGTGSGYQAAILATLGAEVYSVERDRDLHLQALECLKNYNVKLFWGDGTGGLPAHAPYDGIVVTAGGPDVPAPLIEQLKIGGRLVVPVGDKKLQTMTRLVRQADGTTLREEFSAFRFVPLVGKYGWQE